MSLPIIPTNIEDPAKLKKQRNLGTHTHTHNPNLTPNQDNVWRSKLSHTHYSCKGHRIFLALQSLRNTSQNTTPNTAKNQHLHDCLRPKNTSDQPKKRGPFPILLLAKRLRRRGGGAGGFLRVHRWPRRRQAAAGGGGAGGAPQPGGCGSQDGTNGAASGPMIVCVCV